MPLEKNIVLIEELKLVVTEQNKDKAISLMKDLHPADIADVYTDLKIEEAKFLYLLLDDERASDVLAELEEDDRKNFLKVLPSHVVAKKFIENMDSDDAADVLGELSDDRKEEILSNIEDINQASDIVDLLNYSEDSAGGIMAKELIQVNENWTITQCLKEISSQVDEIDEIYYVYVVDDKKILKGILSLKEMIAKSTSTKIAEICEKDIISVKTNTLAIEVAHMMQKYDLVAIPVVNELNHLVGRITFDDVSDIIREEAIKDYQMISGFTEDIEDRDSLYLQIRARLPWLLIGMIGGILGAVVIGNYENTLNINPAVAFFIPLVAAMGGNVGVQSSSIVVQGLANNKINIKNIPLRLLRELSSSLIIAIICSGLIFLFNYLFFSESFALTYAVSLSLFLIIIGAALFGTFIPLALDKIKIDPALATGPFITTANDVIGLLLYFYISQLFFHYFN